MSSVVAKAPPVETPFLRLARDFARSRTALAGLAALVLIVLAALLARWVVPQDPYDLAQLDILDGMMAPGSLGGSGWTYWLGTDDQGRDMLSAIVFGLRTSLLVGVVATLIALAVGVAVGLLAAYAGDRVDGLVMRLVDIQLSFPAILIALILLALLGKGVDKVIVALAAVQWAYYARTIRGSALVERRKEYIEAAQCLALPHRRIMMRHLLPNCLPPLIVVATVQVAHAIALEATLSFLGVGVPVTQPSLGMLIASGYQYMLSGDYWVSLFPGLALLITIVAINLVGDRLRDVLNPRLNH
ncbi:peptide ABC transporter permease (plasmid) [Azospirillum argentinense]|uniref:ABC transporter permease n=1 Tax=Azospirillum argentinense TaxID=2970906 RepID=A0A060DR91_9PROT|nr:ABC transporter permease [Azospirillum argentinense]AIB16356.1 peptide ABC transporter permease [Azospirillum argentinense]EZQ02505.1 peptide ABC transporter permease [Azospirillum argentinense]MBK3799980.1 ABC transporter permease subunit [Azospirillum argentinense]PNQ99113.1 ABC transporter permease [Azospirillum argentinense]